MNIEVSEHIKKLEAELQHHEGRARDIRNDIGYLADTAARGGVWGAGIRPANPSPICADTPQKGWRDDTSPAETETVASGAKQARIYGRFDLIPPAVLEQVARVLEVGAQKYGEDNWRGIEYRSHVNHLLYHANKALTGDLSEDHLAHAICRAMFAWSVLNSPHKMPPRQSTSQRSGMVESG